MHQTIHNLKLDSFDSLYLLAINPVDVNRSIDLGLSLNIIIILLILIIMIFLGSTLFSQKK